METTIIERIKGFANMIGINQKTLNQQLNAKRGVSLLNCRSGNCSGSSNLPSSAYLIYFCETVKCTAETFIQCA